MLKTPQNLTVPLRTYRKKTDKRVSSFLSEYYKNLIHFYGAQKIWCVWSYRGRGTSHFFTSGSEVRDYHKVKKIGLSEGGRKHYGAKRANVSI